MLFIRIEVILEDCSEGAGDLQGKRTLNSSLFPSGDEKGGEADEKVRVDRLAHQSCRHASYQCCPAEYDLFGVYTCLGSL